MSRKAKLLFDRVIGIDLGNGFVKVRSISSDGDKYSLTLPSCFAYLRDVGDSVSDSNLDLDIFEIDGVEYVWGEDITKVEKLTYTYGHENRYRSKAYKVMVQIVMATISRDLEIGGKEKLLVVTGVPSIESGTEKEEEIAQAFYGEGKGSYRIRVNGEDEVFKIERVEVDSQALATIKGRYLAEDGSVAEDGYEEWNVGVVDIGAGTTDLDVVHKLRRQKINHSVPTGFRDIYESIRTEIQKVYIGHHVSDYELLEIIEDVQKLRKKTGDDEIPYVYMPAKNKKPVNFTKAFKDGIREVAMATQQAVMDKWKSQTGLDEILLVGASAEEFREELSEVSSDIIIPQNNIDSNVEGYYRFGVALNIALSSVAS